MSGEAQSVRMSQHKVVYSSPRTRGMSPWKNDTHSEKSVRKIKMKVKYNALSRGDTRCDKLFP